MVQYHKVYSIVSKFSGGLDLEAKSALLYRRFINEQRNINIAVLPCRTLCL
jgi:hypothetical protein